MCVRKSNLAPSATGQSVAASCITLLSESHLSRTSDYVVGAFPLLYTVEDADLNASRSKKIAPEEYFRRMLWFWDPHTKCYPFARHPRYKYLAYSLTARRRSYEKAEAFVSQELPAGVTREQVQTTLSSSALAALPSHPSPSPPLRPTPFSLHHQRLSTIAHTVDDARD